LFYSEQSGEPWRYFTYSLLHDNSEHFFINIIIFLPVGWGLEVVHGTIWVTLLYVIGVS
jgi:membrane associated rhomboid family serine protease